MNKSQQQQHVMQSREPAAPGTRAMFRLGDLVWTPRNVRKTPRTADDIKAMAASIAVNGVMQNLLLVADLHDGKWTGKYGVAGGETRRLGCCYLRDGGMPEVEGFTDDTLLPGLVVAEPEATAASVTENFRRTPLSPADEFEAFKEVFDQCGSVEHVADFFGVTPVAVERRMKLASASPKLFALFREGGMTVDQLMALCVVDDHRRQETAWNAGAEYSHMRNPHVLRKVLTEGKVRLSESSIARFVGADAIEAAGGTVERDLFSSDGEDGYVQDGELLHRLAAQKLSSVAEQVRAEGWAWVEVMPAFGHQEQARYRHCVLTRGQLTKEQASQVKELKAALQAVADRLDPLLEEDDDADQQAIEALEQESAALEAQIEALEQAGATVEEALRPIAGAVVSIGQSGKAQVLRGLIRPEDRKEATRIEKAKQKAQDRKSGATNEAQASPSDTSNDALSRALTLRLGAHRSAALQVLLARSVPVALASLAYSLAQRVLVGCYSRVPLGISANSARHYLTRVDSSLADSRSFTEMETMLESWRARLLAEEDVLGWVFSLPMDEVTQLIAVCVAATVNTVGEQALQAEVLSGDAAAIADAAGLNMADWWTPTASGYLNCVSKAQIVGAVAEATTKEEAAPLLLLKKGEAAARAEALLAGKRWLPALLRKVPSATQAQGS